MPAPQPQTIAADLFKQLELLFEADKSISEFDRARFKRSVDALMRVDASQAYAALAGLHAIEWDSKGAREHVQTCLRLGPSSLNYANAAVTLRQIGLMREACDFALTAAKSLPLSADMQEKVISLCLASGRLKQAIAIFDDATSRGITLDVETLDLSALRAISDAPDFDQDRLEREVECAYQVLRENKIRPQLWSIDEVADPDGGSTVVFVVGFHGQPSEEIALDSQLAVLLAEDPEWDPTRLSVEFECMRVHADEHA